MADLRPLLQNIVAQMTPAAARQNQTMELEIQDDVPLVLADRDRIEQVVANLVGNAMKFTPRNGKIRVALRKRPNVVVVEVSDTGPGIAPQDQPNLFQPYYRIESDRERVPGLGLGLALCKRIIELHGGNIWVESQPGAGSTFVFSLPTDTGPPSAV
jgi:signal transduction histidine kinase